MKARSRDVNKRVAQQAMKAKMMGDPHLPYALATIMRTRKGGKLGGYINRLARQERKTPQQLRVPGCGQNVRDWMTGYDSA